MKVGTGGTSPGGGFIDMGCLVHLCVESVKDLQGKYEVKMNVLAASEPTQVGRTQTEFFHYVGQPGAIKRLLQFACCVGLYSEERWKSDAAANVEADIDFEDSEGHELCGEIQMKPGTGEKASQMYGNLDYRMWALGDPRAVNVPKDSTSPLMQALAKAGKLPKQQQTTPPAGQSGGGEKTSTNGNSKNGNGAGNQSGAKQPAGGGVDPDAF